jgi:pyruvate,water dikinase
MANPLILPLDACSDPSLVGGKAWGLSRLIRRGFSVPPGVCLTTDAYRDALRAAGVDLSAAWARLARASESERLSLLAECQRAVANVALPPSVAERVAEALARMGAGRDRLWAVRSSATDEDTAGATFGGLYRTRLGVPPEAVPDAILDCWRSLWSQAAGAYRCRMAPGGHPPAMAVIVQPLLNPLAAGVAYSRHPITGAADHVVIDAVFGLAEPLASGHVIPDHYVVAVAPGSAAGTVLTRDLADKPLQRVAVERGVAEQALAEERRAKPALSDRAAQELAGTVKAVERALGHAVDVEWAIDEGGTWLLQARAIPPTPRSMPVTDTTCTWSRANFKETLPELPSPLGLSFLKRFMEFSILRHYRRLGCLVPPGLSSVRIIRGRPYINVTLFQGFMAQLGGDPALVTDQMGGPGHPVAAYPPRLPWWRLLKAGLSAERDIRRAAKLAPAWFAAMKQMTAEQTDALLDRLGPADCVSRLERLGRQLYEGDLTFAIVGGVSQGLQVLQFILERWVGDRWRPLLNQSLQGLGTVISAEQILRLRRLADQARQEPAAELFFRTEPFAAERYRDRLAGTRVLREFEAYLEEYGHRAVGESDVMSPRFSETPDYLLRAIRAHVVGPPSRSVEETVREQQAQREAALQEIRRSFAWWVPLWWVFGWWHRRLARYLALREANRHALMYFSAATRRLELRLGHLLVERGVLDQREDIFFLTDEEGRSAADNGGQDWKGLVAVRRAERLRHAAMAVPDVVEPMGLSALSDDRADVGGVFRGMPISAGSAEGPVCVVRSPADLARVRKGDILVVPVIDPGMAPVFGLAVGLVAEMGGTLSHGAIIVREYGLPAVANVRGITKVLNDGERIRVDASLGEVIRSAGRSE